MQRNLDKKTSPHGPLSVGFGSCEATLTATELSKNYRPRGREFFILDALARAARGEKRITKRAAETPCFATNKKTPLNFLCRSNSGAGTEKRPTELVQIVTDG